MSWSSSAVQASAAPGRLVRLALLLARLAAGLAAAIGTAALVGWATGVWWLKEPVPGFTPMVPNAAVMLILSGVSLALSVRPSPRRRWAGQVLALVSLALALTTLAQDLVGRDFGLDTLLFAAPAPRPVVPGLLAIVLLDLALLGLDVGTRRAPKPAELLAMAAGILGSLTLGGLLYGASQFYSPSRDPHTPGMSINVSIALLALANGIVLARPDSGAMAVFVSPHVGGQVARRMLPLALSIPAIGYVATLAQRAGWYRWPGAAVVEGVMGMAVAVGITFAVARSLERTDARRRRGEDETREWKRFFDRATFGAVFGTGDGRFWRVNEAFARMHGYTVAELEGRPIAAVFPADRHADLLEHMQMADEQGGCRWESQHVRKDGSVFPVVIDVSAVRDEHGRLLYRAAYVQEITVEKEAEAVRARLASLVQSSADAIVAKALDGTVLDWNDAAERIFGYTAREMIGCSSDVLLPADRRDERDALRKRMVAGEVVVGLETERVRKDGRRIPVALSLSPIRCDRGQILGFSTIYRDISAIKQLERERQEWAAVVAHDLRQPTATIRLVAEMLARSEGEPLKQRAIERICKAGDRLERMIADLLDVTRVEAQRLVVKPELVDLRYLIAEVIDATPDVANQCRTTIAPEADSAMVDADRFVQVLSNLLSNAHKYGDPEAPIDVEVEPDGDMLRVSVTNEGPGIAQDEIPKLFSRFARTRSSKSGKTPGLGLGLYICRGLVEAHGGALWVESVPGRQTRFQFTLPRAQGAGEERTCWPPSPAAHAP